MNKLQQAIAELTGLLNSCDALAEPLQRAIDLVTASLASGHKLLICGNGGSAADAMHLAAEFMCRFRDDRRPYPAVALGDNSAYVTAVGNDYNFEEVFARQVWGLGQPGDVLIVFSTSGRSRNVVRALEEARARGLKSICFLGRDGGFTKGLATVELIVPGTNTARIQEVHQLLFHVLCEAVDERLPKG